MRREGRRTHHVARAIRPENREDCKTSGTIGALISIRLMVRDAAVEGDAAATRLSGGVEAEGSRRLQASASQAFADCPGCEQWQYTRFGMSDAPGDSTDRYAATTWEGFLLCPPDVIRPTEPVGSVMTAARQHWARQRFGFRLDSTCSSGRKASF